MMGAESPDPIKLFYCYARKDKALREEIEKHLSLLKRSGRITTWCDREIRPGSEWMREVDKHLDTADIILLLVSPDFLASDYCYSRGMLRALERHKAGEALVIPIILRPVRWEGAPISVLEALPTEGKPITTWRIRDEALKDMAEGIDDAVGMLLSQKGKTQGTIRETTSEKAPQTFKDAEHTLVAGNPSQYPDVSSLNSVARLTEDFPGTIYDDKAASRPEVHSPDQSKGDVTEVPFLPNTTIEQVHQFVPQQLSNIIHKNSDSQLQSRLSVPELELPEERRDEFHSKRQQTRRKRLYRYVFAGLTVLLLVSLISSSWWYPAFLRYTAQPQLSNKQSNSENSPLEISFSTTESKLWVIPGNPAQYTLANFPKQRIGGLYTDGHLSAPLYHIYFESRNLSKEQHSNIIIKEMKLEILKIRPLPQRPVPLWMDDEAFHQQSPHKYEAFYLGAEDGFMVADYIKSDYVTNSPGTITISPGETERAEVHVISRIEVDIFFSVQVTYFFATEAVPRTVTLAPTFEIIFADKSSTSLYQLRDGHFVASS